MDDLRALFSGLSVKSLGKPRSLSPGGPSREWADSVVNFSSQYGTDGTSSYTASNLAGAPRIHPKYGDFVEAFVLRTYGPWWQRCPSAARKMRKASEKFRSQDFVELRYITPVIPSSIEIYETYHPGAVVRILACNADPKTKPGEVQWVTLWSGPPQCNDVPKQSRKFAPPLKEIDFPTNLIRLEFNSELCEYYTELDGVELIGVLPTASHKKKDRAEGFQTSLTERLIRQSSLTERQMSTDEDDFERWGYFGMLPDEVIQCIMCYLDVVSLSNVAQTCSLLLKNAYDPLLYSTIDLQSHWNTVDDVALQSLVSRCAGIQHLNLSWTGGGGQITERALCSYLEQCGSKLLTLRLACCRYIGTMTLATVGKVCTHLRELDLQCCTQLESDALVFIEDLGKLRRLNLYSMTITPELLDAIGRKCSLLEHLNIGASISDQENSAQSLKHSLINCLKQLKHLVSLDLWRCRFATVNTIHALANNCPNLEEIDIGWCHGLFRSGFDVEEFCHCCPRLKKMYLTCGRTLHDGHLEAIATSCPLLEQLDILGTNYVTEAGALFVLKGCPKLVFFDVSFCGKLGEEVVVGLRKQFPKVNLKRSFS